MDLSDIQKESELSDLLITRISALRYSDYVSKIDVVISFNYIFLFFLSWWISYHLFTIQLPDSLYQPALYAQS